MAKLDVSQFDFALPEDRIAQYPANERTASRLLVLGNDCSSVRELCFSELSNILLTNDLLIGNDSKVIPARLIGRKPTGGKVEILIERIVDTHCVRVQMKSRKTLRIGDTVTVDDRYVLTVTGRDRDMFMLGVEDDADAMEMIENCGSVPLPPYITRAVERADAIRYQTVYAKHPGSVAAPTAGLHFSEELIREIQGLGVEMNYVSLHVGAGTFAPIRDNDVHRHSLHSERYEIPPSVCKAIQRAKDNGSRVIALGTTTMRALETASMAGDMKPGIGETDLFIKPGFKFRAVDALITNFHLPRSTLLMLVCAFGGTDRIMNAYRYAVDNRFRFYSYGDAMFIATKCNCRS